MTEDKYLEILDKLKESKNYETLASFVSYCAAHPELRFWQALRNWSPYQFILGARSLDFVGRSEPRYSDIEDTFYKEGR